MPLARASRPLGVAAQHGGGLHLEGSQLFAQQGQRVMGEAQAGGAVVGQHGGGHRRALQIGRAFVRARAAQQRRGAGVDAGHGPGGLVAVAGQRRAAARRPGPAASWGRAAAGVELRRGGPGLRRWQRVRSARAATMRIGGSCGKPLMRLKPSRTGLQGCWAVFQRAIPDAAQFTSTGRTSTPCSRASRTSCAGA
jgi:hypothetical protein